MSTHGIRRSARFLTGTLLAAAAAAMLLPAVLYAEIVSVEAAKARVRKGAGNYYEVIHRAQRGEKLKVLGEADGWYKVALPDKRTGFVSKRALGGKAVKGNIRKLDLAAEKGVSEVAASEIMAATKGIAEMGLFATRYAGKHKIDTAVLDQFNNVPFTPWEYWSFKRSLRRTKRALLPGLSGEGITDFDREIGAAIAHRICQKGVSTDLKLRRYVSMVGTAVLELTPLYDETFLFIIIDSPKAESFAAPGGFVFITTGALGLMKDEAELAGVLAHEITHVVERHGVKELERQKTRIAGEKLMDSLDEEVEKLGMDMGDPATTEELEKMADRMFEFVISGRKKADEDTADTYATLLIAGRGYRADGLKTFLLSAGEEADKEKNYSHRLHAERAALIDSAIKKNRLSGKKGESLKKRFLRNTR
jgi:hypothetical protein